MAVEAIPKFQGGAQQPKKSSLYLQTSLALFLGSSNKSGTYFNSLPPFLMSISKSNLNPTRTFNSIPLHKLSLMVSTALA